MIPLCGRTAHIAFDWVLTGSIVAAEVLRGTTSRAHFRFSHLTKFAHLIQASVCQQHSALWKIFFGFLCKRSQSGSAIPAWRRKAVVSSEDGIRYGSTFR